MKTKGINTLSEIAGSTIKPLRFCICVFFICTLLCVGIPAHANITNNEIIDHTKQIPVSLLEKGLPNVAFEKWLHETLGQTWEITWKTAGCEQLGMPQPDKDDVCVLVNCQTTVTLKDPSVKERITRSDTHNLEIKLFVVNKTSGWHQNPSISYVAMMSDSYFNETGYRYPTYTEALFRLSKIKPIINRNNKEIEDLQPTMHNSTRQEKLGLVMNLSSWGIIIIAAALSSFFLLRKYRKGMIQRKHALNKFSCNMFISFLIAIGSIYAGDYYERTFFKTAGFFHGEFIGFFVFIVFLFKFILSGFLVLIFYIALRAIKQEACINSKV